MSLRVCVIAGIVFLALGAVAQAHAHLSLSAPAAGDTFAVAPNEASLSFTEDLEPAFSTVTVTDANGARVDEGKPLISGSTMRVALKPLGPGSYNVHWRAVSVDTHTTEGNFSFTVRGS